MNPIALLKTASAVVGLIEVAKVVKDSAIEFYDWCTEDTEEEKPKITRDRTVFTEVQKERILQLHKEWKQFNLDSPKERRKVADLVDQINKEMGTTKNVRTLRKIWTKQ